MNSASVIGIVKQKGQLRNTDKGKLYLWFTVAVQDDFGKRNINYIDCCIWGTPASNADHYLRVNSFVSVDGRLCSSSKKDDYKTFITAQTVNLLNPKPEEKKEDIPVQKPIRYTNEPARKKIYNQEFKESFMGENVPVKKKVDPKDISGDNPFDEFKLEDNIWDGN